MKFPIFFSCRSYSGTWSLVRFRGRASDNLRVEGIVDPAARDDFYKYPPVRVFRVTPSFNTTVPESSKYPTFRDRLRNGYAGISEQAPNVTTDQLRDGLSLLQKIAKAKHAGPYPRHSAVLDFSSFVQDSGYECLEDGTRCLGDCRDTIYSRGTFLMEEYLCNKTHAPCSPARSSRLIPEGIDALYIVGVNHHLTNHTLYSSFTAYNFPKLASGIFRDDSRSFGYSLTEDSPSLVGTAQRYFSHPAAPYLYVLKFARNCTRDDFDVCLEVESASTDPNALFIDLHLPVILCERSYIWKGLTTGPAVNETILPELIHIRYKIDNLDL